MYDDGETLCEECLAATLGKPVQREPEQREPGTDEAGRAKQ